MKSPDIQTYPIKHWESVIAYYYRIGNGRFHPQNPLDYLSRFGTDLYFSTSCQRRAAEILIKAKKEWLTGGKDPTGLAAAAIYIAGIITDERRTQREIAAMAQVTEVTVRNRYKELIRKLRITIGM